MSVCEKKDMGMEWPRSEAAKNLMNMSMLEAARTNRTASVPGSPIFWLLRRNGGHLLTN